MMSSNPVVAAKRHSDPYAIPNKPLTTRSRQTLQRSVSQANQSQSANSVGRDYSRASSAGSIRTNASNRSTATTTTTANTRSLSKEQVREKMQRPPDIPTCRGGNINVYRCSAEYLEDFWSKQKAENDTRRLAIKRSQEEHQRQLEADAARNPPSSVSRAKPLLSAATVASRTAALKPPPKKATPVSPSTPAAVRTASNVTRTPSATAAKTAVSSNAGSAARVASRTPSSSTPLAIGQTSAGTRSGTISGKAIGTAPRSVSAAKKAPSSTSVASATNTSSATSRGASRVGTATPSQAAVAKRPLSSNGTEKRTLVTTTPTTPRATPRTQTPTSQSRVASARAPSATGSRTPSATNASIRSTPKAVRPTVSTTKGPSINSSTARPLSTKAAPQQQRRPELRTGSHPPQSPASDADNWLS